jgi:hypothetical protein
MSVTWGHWQQPMVLRLRHVGRPDRPWTAPHPAPAERIARRTMCHQDAEADQARWWVNAYSCSRFQR